MKVLVVDDHPLVRQAIGGVLRQLEPDVQVLESASVDEALAAARANMDARLVLLDIHLPGTSGLDGVKTIRDTLPEVPVVVISASEDPADITRALDAGAMGFIPKSQPTAVLLNALRLVLAGGVYLPPAMLKQPTAKSAESLRPTSGGAMHYRNLGLTERQAQVLGLLVQGMPNKVISRELDLAEGTVKIHITAILKALNVSNRTQAVIEVGRLGLTLPTKS